MNAPIPQRVLETAAFNKCMDRLYWAFRDNDGTITRGRFAQICRDFEVESFYVQAALEGAGLIVEKVGDRRTNSDRFNWQPQHEPEATDA